jgi:hypothetical protein
MLWGTGLEVTSDADGGFSLANLPGGTHTLEARAVGFTPAEVPVDIVQGAPGATEVELMNFGVTLDTVRVTGQRLYTSAHEREFERRLRTGVGHVISAADIEKRRPQVLTDLLRTVPGVMVLPGARSGEDVFMRGGQAILGSGLCRPDCGSMGCASRTTSCFRSTRWFRRATSAPWRYTPIRRWSPPTSRP